MSNSLRHVAIIMDGNGRWAKQKGFSRSFGHEEGAKNVRNITKCAAKNNISHLTLYAFSTENWKRPAYEVKTLMKLLEHYLKSELDTFLQNDIRFETIGNLDIFSESLKKTISHVKQKTSNCKGLTQILALNYGSHDELARACSKVVENNEPIDIKHIEKNLDTAVYPPVDLLIRTGGQMRLSNFLLWQIAYAELFFTSTLWPDFNEEEFLDIIARFSLIHRRFGGI